MPQPTIFDVRPVNPVLTNMSIAGRNKNFLAEKIAPFAVQPQKSGTYFIYTPSYWMRVPTGSYRASDGPYTQLGYGVTSSTYTTSEHGYEKLLPDPIRNASQTPEDLQMKDVQFLTNALQMDLESAVAAKLFTSGVWGAGDITLNGTAGTTSVPLYQWDDYANSDPIANAKAARLAVHRLVGQYPTTMFIGVSSWQKLIEHPLLLEKYKYTQKGILTEELIAAVFMVDEVVVGDTSYNSAAEGQTAVGADIWGTNALFLCRNSPTLGVANGAYTFIWDEIGNNPWAIQDYRDEKLRGTMTRIMTHWDINTVSNSFGYMVNACTSS